MQTSSQHLAQEDHNQTSNFTSMAQESEHSARLNEDLGTQKTNLEGQESFDGAAQRFDHSARLNEDLGTKVTNLEGQESCDVAAQGFDHSAQLNENLGTQETKFEDQESYPDAKEDGTGDEEEFSFTFDGAMASPIAAEDAFHDGKIKPMFPLFNQDLLLQEESFAEHLTVNPHVKKLLVEMNKHSLEDDEVSGPYCDWKAEAVAEREGPKKSNSTGFSKLWRLKDLVTRSNSDGKDAFVFLNNQNGSSFRRKEDIKAAVSGGGNDKEKVKKGEKKKTATISSHEVYLKNKAKENDGRKKSYMPYKPEVFGFFTNVNGGITKNVHPY